MRLRLGTVTVADVLAAQPVTTNLLNFMRASIKMIGVSILEFFFSSRRQHTRWPRDWSSDVCSSDLELRASDPALIYVSISAYGSAGASSRSEERRVGKECRSRWSPYPSKKKSQPKTNQPAQPTTRLKSNDAPHPPELS